MSPLEKFQWTCSSEASLHRPIERVPRNMFIWPELIEQLESFGILTSVRDDFPADHLLLLGKLGWQSSQIMHALHTPNPRSLLWDSSWGTAPLTQACSFPGRLWLCSPSASLVTERLLCSFTGPIPLGCGAGWDWNAGNCGDPSLLHSLWDSMFHRNIPLFWLALPPLSNPPLGKQGDSMWGLFRPVVGHEEPFFSWELESHSSPLWN